MYKLIKERVEYDIFYIIPVDVATEEFIQQIREGDANELAQEVVNNTFNEVKTLTEDEALAMANSMLSYKITKERLKVHCAGVR